MKNKNYLQFLFLILPYFKLVGFSEISAISKLFDAWFIIASGVVLYKAVFCKYTPSKFVIACGILQIYLFANTVLQGGFSTNLIRNTIGVLFLLILLDMYLANNKQVVYKCLIVVFSVYSILNICLGKGSLFKEYLFGSRTNLTTVATPILMITLFILLSDSKLRKKPSMVFMAAITVISNMVLIVRESVSTAIITIAVSIVFYMLFKLGMFRKIKAGTYILVAVAYSFVIVIFQSFGYLKAIFSLLGESMTMTGRLLIWSNAMTAFQREPIFGYGVDMQMVARGGYSTSTTYVHNNFLQFCMDGGVVALILFICLLLVTVKDVGKMRTRQARLVLSMNIGFIMGMISEAFTSRNFYYVLLLLMAKMLADAGREKKYMWDNSLL